MEAYTASSRGVSHPSGVGARGQAAAEVVAGGQAPSKGHSSRSVPRPRCTVGGFALREREERRMQAERLRKELAAEGLSFRNVMAKTVAPPEARFMGSAVPSPGLGSGTTGSGVMRLRMAKSQRERPSAVAAPSASVREASRGEMLDSADAAKRLHHKRARRKTSKRVATVL